MVAASEGVIGLTLRLSGWLVLCYVFEEIGEIVLLLFVVIVETVDFVRSKWIAIEPIASEWVLIICSLIERH